MAPSGNAFGQFLWRSASDDTHSKYLMAWRSSATAYSDPLSAVATFTASPGECFQLAYSSSSYAQINVDRRATWIAIRKL
jgi:hypothetical protein